MIEIFTDMGFERTATKAVHVPRGGSYLRKTLFDDYYSAVLFDPAEPLDCTLYVGCDRFSKFMDVIETTEFRSEYSDYLRRKLRKDRWGTLAFALLGIEPDKDGVKFASGGIELDGHELKNELSALQSAKSVREFLFGLETGRFLAAIEGFWAHSFLSFEMAISTKDLLDEIEASLSERPWRLSRQLELPVLQRLHLEYADSVRRCPSSKASSHETSVLFSPHLRLSPQLFENLGRPLWGDFKSLLQRPFLASN